MEQAPPPLRIIAPGSAYRRDEIDATHLSQFTQMEVLCVAPGITLADLKGTAEFFFRELFGPEVECRFRPHFFPFTEPSFEIDIRSSLLSNKWLELAGCGMVDPAVFEAINQQRGDRAYDPDKVSGFAFGFGLERLVMMLTGTPDIRMLMENDLRFLERFV
jgi:phenylalanyl-tRNA synthetase alpha chain